MAVSEPYSELLNAIKAALVDAAGPFAKSDQVALWEEDGADEFAPAAELIERLSQAQPMALVATGASSFGEGEVGGESDYAEDVTVVVYYGVKAPAYDAAYTGDGTPYWGEFPARKWILNKLQFKTPGDTCAKPLSAISVGTLPARQRGLIARVLRFETQFIHQAE